MMQKISCLLLSQVVFLLFVGSYAWSRQVSDDTDLLKRLAPRPMYDFGLGKRSIDDAADSYEDLTSYPLDAYNYPEKKSAPSSMYSFGLGKRNRAYGFGLGKRLESMWKYPSASNRQERRSKIYSFGLGKRGGPPMGEDYFDAANGMADKRANQRQFSFGLGKRDVTEGSHVNMTS